MGDTYGRREKITLVWEDACRSSNIKVRKGQVVFEGSGKHCAEQAIRWMYNKGFIDPVGICLLSARLDFTLFGRIWKSVEDEKLKAGVEPKAGVLGEPLP